MSATSMPAAGTPLAVVDVLQLADLIRHHLANPEGDQPAYTDIFTARKTDFGLSPGVAITASRVLAIQDAHAIMGWAVTETTGTAAAAFRLHDGNLVGGEAFARVNLQANESVREWFSGQGVRCSTGRIFLEVISGSFEGVLFYA